MANNFRDIGPKQVGGLDIGALQTTAATGASSYTKTLTANCTTASALSRTFGFGKLLVATCTSTSTLIKGIGKKLAATCTTTSTVASTKALLRLLTATCTSTLIGTASKAFLKVLTATCTTTSTVLIVRAFLKVLTATCTSTSSLTKRLGLKLLATCTSTSTLIKGIAKTLTATCTSTVTGAFYKGVRYTKSLIANCVTSSAVQVVFAAFVQLLQSDALKLYRPKGYPTLKDDPSTYILAELRKIAAAMEQHVQVTKDLEQRLNNGGL
jgi:hypothetical protein